jgi:hypothetical protein
VAAGSGRSSGVPHRHLSPPPSASAVEDQVARFASLQQQREDAEVEAAIAASLSVSGGAAPAPLAHGGSDVGLSEEEQLQILLAQGDASPVRAVPREAGPAPPAFGDFYLSEEDQLRIMAEGGDPEEAILRLVMERSQPAAHHPEVDANGQAPPQDERNQQ